MSGAFAARHIGVGGADRTRALAALGLGPEDSVVERALPAALRAAAPPELPEPVGEAEVLELLRRAAARNSAPQPMIGLGYYGAHTPSVLRRGILENPTWYTAYTPYQPEIAQGRLEALLVFQTVIADLTGLPVAGASLLDEATAVAEAANLAVRADRAGRRRVAVDTGLFPQTRAVLETRAELVGVGLVPFDARADAVPGGVSGVVVQYQAAWGALTDLEPLARQAHDDGALLAVAADPLALALLRAPGAAGADIAIGSTQRFGLPLGFGGPHAAYIAVRRGLERQLPGRLVGVSRDADGARAYRLALQTREQHIRRDKATSNICTAQVLPAVMAAMFAVWHGAEGLRGIALEVRARAARLAAALRAAGLDLAPGPVFDTLAVRVPGRAREVRAAARAGGVAVWAQGPDQVWVSVDQTTGEEHLAAVAAAFGAP
ncbi:MAG: hypothetical protein LBT54_01170, partial [Bifidobacteriaceae bacterium]|nr:hypothetical protein [Bifidobacteriaceae bacterium]